MSKMKKEDLEKMAKHGKRVREVLKVVLYRDPKHPDVVQKVCPYCGRVFDRYLLLIGGMIGCRECATARFKARAFEWIAAKMPGLIDEAATATVGKLRRLLSRV